MAIALQPYSCGTNATRNLLTVLDIQDMQLATDAQPAALNDGLDLLARHPGEVAG